VATLAIHDDLYEGACALLQQPVNGGLFEIDARSARAPLAENPKPSRNYLAQLRTICCIKFHAP